MTDFEMLVFPHRAARRLPISARFEAAVVWAEARLRKENPSQDEVARKLSAGQGLTKAEIEVAIAALSPKPKRAGRPITKQGRNLSLRFLVNLTAREFELSRTRGNEGRGGPYSAADAVADAMKRIGLAPRGFDRLRKIHATAGPEEAAFARAYMQRLDAQLWPILRPLGGYAKVKNP